MTPLTEPSSISEARSGSDPDLVTAHRTKPFDENEVDSRMPVPVFSRMDGCFTTKFVVNDTFCDAKDSV